MTVNKTKQAQHRVFRSALEAKANDLLPSPETTAGEFGDNLSGEVETESSKSSDEMESPKSVGKWRKESVHSQILRIIEEDSHLGEDNCGVAVYYNNNVDLVVLARPILPRSPLSGQRASTRGNGLQRNSN